MPSISPSSESGFWSQDHRLPEASETEVRDKFLKSFLVALGWPDGEWRSELWVKAAHGSEFKDKKLDAVICDPSKVTKDKDKTFAPVKHSSAVFEFKQSGTDIDSAARQARYYAYFLEAPLCVLIDGDHIRIYDTYRPLSSAVLLKVQKNELHKQRGDIETYLRRDNHHATCNILRSRHTNEFDMQCKRIVTLASTRRWTEIHIKVLDDGDMVQWLGPLPQHDINRFWGATEEPNLGNPVSIRLEHKPDKIPPELQIALLRMGTHGGIQELYVPNQAYWIECSKEFLNHNLGKLNEEWCPRNQRVRQGWSILPLSEYVGQIDTSSSQPEELQCLHIATHLHNIMNVWCWARTVFLVDEIARNGHSDSLQGLDLHASVRSQIQDRWGKLRSHFNSIDKKHQSQFMSSMLAPAFESDCRAAQLRLGPKVVDFVAKGILFLLILAGALEVDCLPHGGDAPSSPENIDFLGYVGHLLAVNTANTAGNRPQPIAQILAKYLTKEPRPLVLPCCPASHRDLSSIVENWKPIGKTTTGQHNSKTTRLDHSDPEFLVFSLSTELLHKISTEGIVPTRAYLKEMIKEYALKKAV